MKVVVIGLGSMGKRRIRLLRQYWPDYEIIGVDTNEQRRYETAKMYQIDTTEDLNVALKVRDISCAFVSTSPLAHASIIEQCLENHVSVFTEINVISDGYDRNIMLARQNNLVLFLSSTFLYRKEVDFIKHIIQQQTCRVNYTYHVGQYLPDWHPWENFKDFFVNEKRTNGCRELFAIELPWIVDTFGEIVSMTALKDKMSSLEVNYADNYLLLIEHVSGARGMLGLDIVARKAVRNLEVYGENMHLFWDGTPQGLCIYDVNKKECQAIDVYEEIDRLDNYSEIIIENAYYEEIANFFDVLEQKGESKYSFEKDKVILGWIDKIEQE